MLESLKIENIALIKSQFIELKDGLNVLTGETGAGKSLIIDSLSLLLGERADKGLISRGEKTASVEAVFSNIDERAKQILKDLGQEEEDRLIITRKISQDGKNECRVNGNAFTLSMLKRLSAPLMDLHGQFEHQNLLKVSAHLSIIDAYGGKAVQPLLARYQELNKEFSSIEKELSSYQIDEKERARTLDLLSFQIEEIDNAAFVEGEEEKLKEFRNQALHQEKISEALESASGALQGDGYQYDGVADSVKKVISTLGSITNYYPDASGIEERLSSVKIELEDIADTLQQMKDGLYIDEELAAQNEKRLDLLSSFKKKYGSTIEEINEYRREIGEKYDSIERSEERINELVKRQDVVRVELVKTAKELSDARKNVAKTFEKAIKDELSDLGMKNSSFVVCFKNLPIEERNLFGFDRVEFMFSANLGQEVKPLKDVASGGEMSRFMLAVKNVTAAIEGVGTLVFDEIDSGVSGQIALKLAEKLSMVSNMAQVICVTHLPQIASYGDNHLVIEKNEADGKTTTRVYRVDGEDRVNEIARLISGNLTEHALSHARELLDNGKNFKK